MLYTLRMFWARSLLNRVIVVSLVGLFCCCPTLAGLSQRGSSTTTAPTSVAPQAVVDVAPTEATAAPTIATVPTATAEPPSSPPSATAPPAKPVPLTAEGLSSILIQPGDLPDGWSGDELFDESPVDYEGPTPRVVLNQWLVEPGAKFASGGVVLWVFENTIDARTAYESRHDLIQRVVDADAERLMPSIGDQSLLVPGKGTTFVTNQIVFQRCTAVVEIDLGANDQVDWTTNFASRLDQRLQPSVCS
jgi:hypothetical protein